LIKTIAVTITSLLGAGLPCLAAAVAYRRDCPGRGVRD
jgi:hypothetical protein